MSPSPDSTALSAALELRPLRLSELLDRMFQLYRRYFVPLFLLAAIIYSFNFLLNLGSEYLQGGRSLNQTLHLLEQLQHGQNPVEAAEHLPLTLAALALGLVSMLFLQIGTGVLCFYASDLYLGRLTPLRTCLQVLRRKMVTIALCSLLKWTFITLAFVPCLLAIGSFVILAGKLNLWSGLLLLSVIVLLAAPGFILIVRFLLTTPLIVLENEGVWGSLRRSSEMARYNPGLGFWYWGATRLSLVFLVVVVIKLLIAFLSGLPVVISSLTQQAQNLSAPAAALSPAMILTHLLNYLGGAVLAPLSIIGLLVFYYDVKVRKEGFDLQLLATALTPAGNKP